jgi:hypothetical protein
MKTGNPLDRAKDAFRKAVTKAQLDARQAATVGWRKSETDVQIAVPGRPNYVYVTKSADQTVTVALNRAGVPLNAFLPVWVVLEHNTLVVIGRDNSNAAALAGVPDSEYGVPSHPHAFLSLSDVLTTDLADGQMFRWDATAGKLVNVSLTSDDIAEGATNLYATATNVGAIVHAAAAKVTPVDADTLPLIDSAASNALKKVTWANIKATLKTYFDTLYVVLLGKSGGQHIRGGTDAGDDLTLESTSHATKGDVILQPNGGDVVFDPSADSTFKLGDQNITEDGTVYNTGFNIVASNGNAQFAMIRASANAAMMMSAVAGDTFRRFIISVSGRFQWGPGNATRDVTLERTGVGELTLEGHLKETEGGGYKTFAVKTGIDGTAQTIVANGSGDVTQVLMAWGIVSDGTNRHSYDGTPLLPGTESSRVVGTSTYALRVNADGSIDVRRTAGASAGKVALLLIWF